MAPVMLAELGNFVGANAVARITYDFMVIFQ